MARFSREPRTTWTTVYATLDGSSSWVELVSAPPAGESRRVVQIFGQNNAGAARVMSFQFNDGATPITIWKSRSVPDAGYWNQKALGPLQEPPDVILSETTHSLTMTLNGTGTDIVVAIYETVAQ